MEIYLFPIPLLLSFLLGYTISLRLKSSSCLERVVVGFSLGFGIISFLMSVLGVLYNFSSTSIIISYAILLSILLFLNLGKIKKFRLTFGKFRPSKHHILLSVIVLPFVSFSLFHIIAFPEVYPDSTIYEYWAKVLFQNKNLGFVEGGPTVGLGFASNYPSAFQVLGAFFYSFTGEGLIVLRLLSLLCFVLLVAVVYLWSKNIFTDKSYALFSLIFLVTSPFAIEFSRNAAQYMYLVLNLSISFYFLYRFYTKNDKSHLYLSSVFGAFSASASYLGLVYLILLPAFLLNKRGVHAKTFLLSALLFLIVISPWYLRNLVLLGNPVWPFGGGGFVDKNLLSSSLHELENSAKLYGFNYSDYNSLINSVERLFLNFSISGNSMLILLSLGGLFFWHRKKDKNVSPIFIMFFVVLLSYTITGSYFERYLSLLITPAVLLSAYFFKSLYEIKKMKFVVPILISALFVFYLKNSFSWSDCPAIQSDVLNYTHAGSGKALEDCFGDISKVWLWINSNTEENATIVTSDFRLYYYNRTVYELYGWKFRDAYYDKGRLLDILRSSNVSYFVSADNSSLPLKPTVAIENYYIFKLN